MVPISAEATRFPPYMVVEMVLLLLLLLLLVMVTMVVVLLLLLMDQVLLLAVVGVHSGTGRRIRRRLIVVRNGDGSGTARM